MNAKEVLGFAKSKNIEMVDLKFLDFLGTWQHFAIPINELEEDSFEEGFGFDGSSIRGWQPIHASDMLVIPDPETAVMDPFIDPADAVADLQHRRPDHQGELLARPAQHRAEGRGVPEVDRHRRHGLLRAGGRVLHLRRHPLRRQSRTPASTTSTPTRGRWNTGRDEKPNLGYKPRHKEGYFPVPPTDSQHDLRDEMVRVMEQVGIQVEAQHHEVATAGQAEIDMRFDTLVKMADALHVVQVHRQERRAEGRQDRHLHAEAALRRQRLRHAHAPVPLEGRQAALRRRRSTAGCRRWRCATSAGS